MRTLVAVLTTASLCILPFHNPFPDNRPCRIEDFGPVVSAPDPAQGVAVHVQRLSGSQRQVLVLPHRIAFRVV